MRKETQNAGESHPAWDTFARKHAEVEGVVIVVTGRAVRQVEWKGRSLTPHRSCSIITRRNVGNIFTITN